MPRRWLAYGVATVLSLVLLIATMELVRRLVAEIMFYHQHHSRYVVTPLVKP